MSEFQFLLTVSAYFDHVLISKLLCVLLILHVLIFVVSLLNNSSIRQCFRFYGPDVTNHMYHIVIIFGENSIVSVLFFIVPVVCIVYMCYRPQFRLKDPPDLSLSVSGGKETNQDFHSSGERIGMRPPRTNQEL